ncbi:MAG: helix-turn-helix transcriptional regulator [Leptospirales bacterium]|nr:helix-turn-helix transcriptional regulator [Leptospirales bacterium]
MRGLVGGLLALSVVCYVVLQFFRGADRPLLLLPLQLGGLTVSFWLYAFSKLLFSDEPRLPRTVWLILIVLLLIGTILFFTKVSSADRSFAEAAIVLSPRVIALGLVIAAIVTIYKEGTGDLVEARRAFRRRFILSVGSSAFAILTLEIYMRGQCPPVLMDFVNSVAILLVSFVIAVSVLRLQSLLIPDVIDGVRADSASGPNDSPLTEPTADEMKLETRLREFIETNRGFAEESLTIRTLATRLNVHEYKLRRLINLRLGFRNFNDYLNHYRVDAACKVLRDASQSDVPILRIAMDLGYGSLAPFNRAFRARTGKSPTQYRLEFG